MSTQTITTSVHRAFAGFGAAQGIASLDPSMGTPPARVTDASMQWHCLALTPTAGTVKLTAPDNILTITDGTIRVDSQDAIDPPNASNLRYLCVWARRKPGSTGAIAAQTIQFGGSSVGNSIQEMGRIHVAAAAAGEEPVSDVFCQQYLSGHSLFTCSDTQEFYIIFSAGADTDIELVIELMAEPI